MTADEFDTSLDPEYPVLTRGNAGEIMRDIVSPLSGTVEKGRYHNDDADNSQPWLPDGPIPHTVTWRKEGYVPRGVPHPADARHEQSIDQHGRWLIPRVEDSEHRYHHGDTARFKAPQRA